MLDHDLNACSREALRRLCFTWVPFEAGAPTLDPLAPFGSPDPLADLAQLDASGGPCSTDPDRVRRLYVEALNALLAFVTAAAPRLTPGRYQFDAADAAHLRATATLLADLELSFDPGVIDDDGFLYPVPACSPSAIPCTSPWSPLLWWGMPR